MQHVTHLQAFRHSAPTKRAPKPAVPEAEIQHRVALADAALGAAGHQVTDARTRALARQVAAGEITGDEAIARLEAIERDQ